MRLIARKEEIMSNANSNTHNEVPRTEPKAGVFFGNIVALGMTWAVASIILLPFFEIPQNFLWGLSITGIVFGVLIATGGFAITVPDWYGVLVFDPLSKSRRVVFAGFNFKLLWEQLESGLTDLKREISSGDKDTEIEKFPTDDPAEVMEAKIIIYFQLDTHGTPAQASANFIRFRSIEEHALMVIVRQAFVKMFGQYYATHEMEELLNCNKIQKEVEALEDPTNRTKIYDLVKSGLEHKYGIHIGVILSSSKPDEATKNMKRTPAMAEALRDARIKLMSPHKLKDKAGNPIKDDKGDDIVIPGMTKEEASRASLLLDPNTDYTEKKETFEVNIDAKGVQNMRHVSFTPGFVGGGARDNNAKKGGKK